jgi:cytoskeleton protein RodZ
VKKLEALESDRLDQLPDAVFLRGLASSVCRALKMDPGPVLGLLPQSTAPRLAYDESGLNTPFHTPGDIAKTPFLDRLSRPMVLAALAVLMGALVLIFFPSSEQRAELGAIVTRPPATATEAVPAAAVATTVSPTPTPAAPVTPAAKPAAAPAPAAVRETPAAPAKPVVQATAPAATPAAVVTAKPAPAPAAAAQASTTNTATAEAPVRKKLASSGIVVFKTREASWIEVTDANGAIQLSRMIEPGEPVGASGPLPLSVTIGRADVTEVQVRGKPFSLEPVTKQGVARFEVK